MNEKTYTVEGQKHLLRSRLLTVREAYGQLDDASEAVVRRLARLPELAAARVVSGYVATRSEVDIAGALRQLLAADAIVCLPWVDGDHLRLSAVTDLDQDLAPGWRGLSEPHPSRRRSVAPSTVDVVLAPGVGFDRAGHRLGYGGGHFDRLLGRLRRGTVVVGIALEEQVVTNVPTTEHDRPVDLVVTPSRTLRCSRD